MHITYNPKVRSRRRKHGFLRKSILPGGKKVLARRRLKGRSRLAL